MAKVKSVFTCQECGYQSAKWLGKCPDCNQWNSFSEEEVTKASKIAQKVGTVLSGKVSKPKNISEIQNEKVHRYFTGINEFDRVMGRYRDWETDRKSTRLNSSHRL